MKTCNAGSVQQPLVDSLSPKEHQTFTEHLLYVRFVPCMKQMAFAIWESRPSTKTLLSAQLPMNDGRNS